MAAAGEALRELVRGPVHSARLVHRGPHAHYLVADGPAEWPSRARVFALLGPAAVRVPIGVLLHSGFPAADQPVTIGEGAVTIGEGAVTRHAITRWWPTRVTPLTPSAEASVAMSDRSFRNEPAEVVLGLGEGLTPESDDELAGRLVALHAFGRRAEALELARAVRHRLERQPNATTAVSAALLEAACEGHAVPPLLAWLSEGCPRDSASRRAVLAVGHTSGAALVRGVESIVQCSTPQHEEVARV
jgi:hypothetical protein